MGLPLARVLLKVHGQSVRLGYDLDLIDHGVLPTTTATSTAATADKHTFFSWQFTAAYALPLAESGGLLYVVEKEAPITNSQLDFLVSQYMGTQDLDATDDTDPSFLSLPLHAEAKDSSRMPESPLDYTNTRLNNRRFNRPISPTDSDADAKHGPSTTDLSHTTTWDSILSFPQAHPEFKRNRESKHALSLDSTLSHYFTTTLTREQEDKYYSEVEQSLADPSFSASYDSSSPGKVGVDRGGDMKTTDSSEGGGGGGGGGGAMNRRPFSSDTSSSSAVVGPTLEKLRSSFAEASMSRSMSDDDFAKRVR